MKKNEYVCLLNLNNTGNLFYRLHVLRNLFEALSHQNERIFESQNNQLTIISGNFSESDHIFTKCCRLSYVVVVCRLIVFNHFSLFLREIIGYLKKLCWFVWNIIDSNKKILRNFFSKKNFTANYENGKNLNLS